MLLGEQHNGVQWIPSQPFTVRFLSSYVIIISVIIESEASHTRLILTILRLLLGFRTHQVVVSLRFQVRRRRNTTPCRSWVWIGAVLKSSLFRFACSFRYSICSSISWQEAIYRAMSSRQKERANEAEEDDEWLFDSIVGYLTSPIWKSPIEHFFEQNCSSKPLTCCLWLGLRTLWQLCSIQASLAGLAAKHSLLGVTWLPIENLQNRKYQITMEWSWNVLSSLMLWKKLGYRRHFRLIDWTLQEMSEFSFAITEKVTKAEIVTSVGLLYVLWPFFRLEAYSNFRNMFLLIWTWNVYFCTLVGQSALC